MDSSAVICMSKATCCRSERGYPARIPGIPIPNGKPAFRVLVGSFLMRFRSGPGFSAMPLRGEREVHQVVLRDKRWIHTFLQAAEKKDSSIHGKIKLSLIIAYIYHTVVCICLCVLYECLLKNNLSRNATEHYPVFKDVGKKNIHAILNFSS